MQAAARTASMCLPLAPRKNVLYNNASAVSMGCLFVCCRVVVLFDRNFGVLWGGMGINFVVSMFRGTAHSMEDPAQHCRRLRHGAP